MRPESGIYLPPGEAAKVLGKPENIADQEFKALSTEKQYELYWEAIKKQTNPTAFGYYWRPDARKGYVEQGVTMLVDIHEQRIDTIIFVDRSARPLAGLFRGLWNRVYPQEQMPAMRFIAGRRAGGKKSLEDDASRIEQLKTSFAGDRDVFSGKTVLIMDEVAHSGHTLENIKRELTTAFPRVQEVKFGAVSDGNVPDESGRSDFLAIGEPTVGIDNPPSHSRRSFRLNEVLYGETNEEMIKEPSNIFAKRVPGVVMAYSQIGRFAQIGQHETLDNKSMRSIDVALSIMRDNDEDERARRIMKIRDAYDSLRDPEEKSTMEDAIDFD